MNNPTKLGLAFLAAFSMTANAWWGSPYGYDGAYGPFAPWIDDQHQAMNEQQTRATQDAIEAQRKIAEQFTADQSRNPYPPFSRPSFYEPPADIAARRDQIQKQMETRRAEIEKRVAEQRKAIEEQRAARRRAMEERRLNRDI